MCASSAFCENCELLSLADGHVSNEKSLERCARAIKHAGAREAIACGVTNGRKHVERSIRVSRASTLFL